MARPGYRSDILQPVYSEGNLGDSVTFSVFRQSLIRTTTTNNGESPHHDA